MEKQIKSELISLEKQIEILERVKHKPTISGLCNDIDRAIESLVEDKLPKKSILIQPTTQYLAMYIPLFNFENAKALGGTRDVAGFWWRVRPYDFEERINFVNWMITQIKQEIENGKTKN